MSLRGRARIIGVLLMIITVGACASLADLSALQDQLIQAGYQNVNVHHDTTNGYDTLTIAAVGPAAQPPTGQDVLPVARIVWETYPQHIDELRVQLNGYPGLRVTRDGLEQTLGPRKAGFEKADSTGSTALLVVLVLVGVAAVIVAVMLIARRRRRRRPPPDPPYPAYLPPTYPAPPASP